MIYHFNITLKLIDKLSIKLGLKNPTLIFGILINISENLNEIMTSSREQDRIGTISNLVLTA